MHTPPTNEQKGKVKYQKVKVMVEKMNYKKYLNYRDEVTEVVESDNIETVKIESEKDNEIIDYLVEPEYDQVHGINEID